MSRMGTVSHYFPGANTPQGFVSRYDQIASAEANKVIILKGGPGVGKSTFLKGIARDLLERGYDVEYHHCSADNNSIDAIYIPAADAALMDGTAPHVVDPKCPGAVDEIINLGAYWNEAALRAPAHREAIIRLTRGYKFRFQRAYEARRAARAFLDEWAAYYEECLDVSRLSAASEELIAMAVPDRLEQAGRARRLFASAITYDGPKHWLSSLFDDLPRRIILQGPPGTGKEIILGRLAETALARGYSLDLFHCPMHPERIDHLRVRATGVGVISSFWPHEYEPKEGDRVIDTGSFVDAARLSCYTGDIAGAEAAYRTAIEREIQQLGRAKEAHDELERYYIPHMDFTAVEDVRKSTLVRILALIEERQGARF